jgi:N-acetylmuramoyl-L-alanine amidase
VAALPLVWIIDALRQDGLPVREYPEARTRAARDSNGDPLPFTLAAIMWHHDASVFGPSPYVPKMLWEDGNGVTPPPLCHCWVDTAGTWWVGACGRANHAGIGAGWGVVPANAGNRYALGIETDHTIGEPWPQVQLVSLRHGTAAIARRANLDVMRAVMGHKEYAPGRKPDPDGLNMNDERQAVRALVLSGGAMTTAKPPYDQGDRDKVDEILRHVAGGLHWDPAKIPDDTGNPGSIKWALIKDVVPSLGALRTAVAGLSSAYEQQGQRLAAMEDQLRQLAERPAANATEVAAELMRAGHPRQTAEHLVELLGGTTPT